ncbi:hypothetical protein F5Y19DRAFT_108489 [Xylariaceae sp. FL1651]|nr:hypothetical protein F5Y19DRAFT_108489 [Xylariaceae sp. FL1651]
MPYHHYHLQFLCPMIQVCLVLSGALFLPSSRFVLRLSSRSLCSQNAIPSPHLVIPFPYVTSSPPSPVSTSSFYFFFPSSAVFLPYHSLPYNLTSATPSPPRRYRSNSTFSHTLFSFSLTPSNTDKSRPHYRLTSPQSTHCTVQNRRGRGRTVSRKRGPPASAIPC